MRLGHLWHNGKRYYYYETYDTWQEAYRVAQYYKKKNRSRYYIMKIERGMFLEHYYRLYMNRVFTMGVW